MPWSLLAHVVILFALVLLRVYGHDSVWADAATITLAGLIAGVEAVSPTVSHRVRRGAIACSAIMLTVAVLLLLLQVPARAGT